MTFTTPNTKIHEHNRSASMSTQPHGIHRVAENLGLALVNWSRSRTQRARVSPDEYLRLAEAHKRKQQRDQDALRFTHRIGL